ncbi:uncharacterized protein [Littorina saxatilis]|uniref:Threonylcarbamoyl-AMP synthase n=1 Tax=Littorina saxatilis TaxID=31220 RepID=A0AAN9B6M3_9CAEN
MAVLVRRSSATLAAIYVHFIILVILCIFNFTVLTGELPVHKGYGLALIILSTIAAVLCITAQDPDDTLLRSFMLCVSVLWTAVGIYHVTEGFNPTGTDGGQALAGGYAIFLLIFLFFIFGSLYHRAKFAAVMSLGYFLACIFEMCSLWRPLRTSVGAYYLLMAALALYSVATIVLKKYRDGEPSMNATIYLYHSGMSRDYVPLGHAMNTLAFAICAGHTTRVFPNVSLEFMWILTAGCYQLLAAIIAVRRSDTYNGFYFFLHSMFWISNGFNFAVEYTTGVPVPPIIAVVVIFFVIFFVVGVASLFREIYQFLQNIALCLLAVAFYVDGSRGAFLGAMGWILLVISLYGLAAHITRAKSSTFKLPLGMRCMEGARFTKFLQNSCKCCVGCLYGKLREPTATGRKQALFSRDFILGYTKYFDLDVVGFASNAIAVLAILWIPQGLWVMPWAIAFGGLTQYIVGSVCFARGLTFEACSFYTFGSLWLIWGPFRGLGVLAQDNGPATITGIVGFIVVGVLQLLLALTVSKAWVVLMFMFIMVCIGFILFAVGSIAHFVYEIVIGIVFVLVCLYCFLSTILKAAVGRDIMPFGKPFLQVSFLHSQGPRALWADARRATGVKAIADIMNKGGIVGIPTDVVYVLVAAVKFPEAVRRAYTTKKDAEDRPMSMWISRVEQLDEGRELFGELVWAFMNEVWPSTVSCVIPKGLWLENLGIGDANALVGRPDSIAVRMPDNCVTSYLVDQTGPVATTSANPTGEADTTHHLQVLAKLGMENVDGILCSGPSPENMASTVVDTRRMTQGQLSFFRIGVVPRQRVEAIFDYVRTRFNNEGSTLPPSITATGGGQVNPGFIEDENNNDDNDSGVSGGNGNGSQGEDDGSGDNVPLVAESASHLQNSLNLAQPPLSPSRQGIVGHENPVYDNSADAEETFDGSDFSSFTSGRLSIADEELGRQSPAQSGDGRASSPSFEEVTGGSSPYEAMVVLPSGAMQMQNAKQIGGRQPPRQQSTTGSPAPHFRMNPVFTESQKI